jgi:hypothetical protein
VSTADDLQSLLDRTRIIDVIVGAANAMDAQDWRRLRACLADEIDTDYRDFRGEPPARVRADDYVAARRRGLAGLRTVHISTNHAVEIEGDRARCVSAYRIYRVDPAAPADQDRLDTAGHYEHGLVRAPGGWRISRIVQTVVVRAGHAAVHGAFRRAAPPAAAERPGPEAP